MRERCRHCGYVFEYDDETTIIESMSMVRRHFEERHQDVMSQPGGVVHYLATGDVAYEEGIGR